MTAQPYSDLRILRRILFEVRPYRLLIGCVFLLSLLATPLGLLKPLPFAIVIDSVLGSKPLPGFLGDWLPPGPVGYGAWLLIAVIVFRLALAFLAQLQAAGYTMLHTYVGEKLTLGFRARLLNQAQRLSFTFHDKRGTADSIYRIQYDSIAVKHVAVHGLISLVTSSVTLVVIAIVMLKVHTTLALISLAVVPLLYYYLQVYKKKMIPRYTEAKELESSALGVVQEVLTSFRVVKAFGREKHEQARFVDHSRRGVRMRLRLQFAELLYGTLTGMTTAAAAAAVLYVGVRSVQSGALTLGGLFIVLAYLDQLFGPLKALNKQASALPKLLASARRAFELMDEAPDVVEKPDAIPLQRARGAIEFRGVSFAYEKDGNRVLDRVSFRVEPGTRLGIVGRTGAGKSTLVSLLTRFYDPSDGSILIDGTDLRDYKLADLRRQFSIVLQDPVLFKTTIGDNIAYARPDAPLEQIVEAAKAAGAHDFIDALPNGYDSVVGERGMSLSGGERQRIALARAFLKNAPILVLDEPTSSVDVDTETAIMQTLYQLMEGRTTLMIAHRLSTLEGCDQLLRIRDRRAELEQPLSGVRAC